MTDERTPTGRHGVLQRRRAERERLLRDARAAQEPQAWEDEEERSSVTIEAPPEVLRKGFIVKGVTSMRPVIESIVPASVRDKMNSKGGKRAALVAGIVSTVGLVIEVLRQLGAFKGH